MPNGGGKFSECSEKSGVGRVRFRGSIPGRNKTCFLLQMFRPTVAVNQPLTQRVPEPVPEVEEAGEWIWPLSSICSRLRKYGAMPLPPPSLICLHDFQRINITFNLPVTLYYLFVECP
jgi:hypothetical protein